MWEVLAGACALVVLLGWGWRWSRPARSARLPPGPLGVPVLGYLPWLDPARPHESLAALARRYGPICSVRMGGVLTVVLSEERLVRAAFAKEECAGRAPLYLTHGIMQGHGLICAEGALWRDQRRLVATTLKNLGMLKQGCTRRDKMASRIQEGVRSAVEALLQGEGRPLDPHAALTHSVGNVVNSVVFGRTWAAEDPTWQWLQRIQDEGTKLIGVAGAINFLPFLRFLPTFSRTIRWLKEGQREQHALYADLVREARRALEDPVKESAQEAEPEHILGAWLLEQQRRQEQQGSPGPNPFYSDRQLHFLLADLFGAGLDTTVTTLRWLLLYLAVNIPVQERMQKELDEVLEGRSPALEDLPALPYTQAVVMETQRIRSVTPVGIPHGARQDTTLEGYDIPKGTMLIPLQWAIHMDPVRWPEPQDFRPDRFLGEDGGLLRPEGFIPFQTGKRMCVGDEWARMILLLFAAGLLQRLRVRLSLPAEHTLDDNLEDILEGVCGITLTPRPYELLCEAR